MSHFKRSQRKYVKGQYRVCNWSQYEAGLRNRGSLTVWISEEELGGWKAPCSQRRRRGRRKVYSDRAIETALTVGMVFHLPLRQTEGFLRSLFDLLKLDVTAPDHSTVSKRAQNLGKVPFREPRGNKPVHLLVDSTGLKIHVGHLRKPPKNRNWRKLHLAVDEKTGEIVACDLTSKRAHDSTRAPALLKQIDRPIASAKADAAYDKVAVYKAIENHSSARKPRVLIPPTKNAQLDPSSASLRERNRNIRSRRRLGKRKWHRESGYSRRALAETAFSRYKTIIGPAMRSRRLVTQRVEARIGCKIINRMTPLGMPDGYMVG